LHNLLDDLSIQRFGGQDAVGNGESGTAADFQQDGSQLNQIIPDCVKPHHFLQASSICSAMRVELESTGVPVRISSPVARISAIKVRFG
jgi:hypothetical protein